MNERIFLLISNLTGGGAQRVVSVLSKGLSSHFNLYLILHDGNRVDYSYCGQVVDLETPVKKSMLAKVSAFFRRTWKVRNLKKTLQPVAVISFLESSNFVNLLAGKKGKTIISVRNYKSQQNRSLLGKIYHIFIRKLYMKSDLIIVPSEGIKADLGDFFKLKKKKIKVIFNPYDFNYIINETQEPLESWARDIFNNPVVVSVGSLSRQKGQWHLIRAFQEVSKRLPDLRLLILGEGNLRPYLEQLVFGYGLQSSIKLPGFVKNPFKLISRAKLFILPSLFEGFPNALVEAMACSVPVIASDCLSGPREILAPSSSDNGQAQVVERVEYGVLVPVCSGIQHTATESLEDREKIMADAIIELIENEELNQDYRLRSFTRACDFKSDVIIKQWLDTIKG